MGKDEGRRRVWQGQYRPRRRATGASSRAPGKRWSWRVCCARAHRDVEVWKVRAASLLDVGEIEEESEDARATERLHGAIRREGQSNSQ
eukprot:2726777-Pleurochrysis_carterae.AAC.2